MTDMTPYYEREGICIYVGDNREVLPHIEPAHAVVTDPPYGLSFMGKGWDHQVPGVEFWQAIGEAMLPGAHLLAFGGTRTYHRMAVAIEDAGYEIRDTLQWLYGSGFPKSHDVSKAIESKLLTGKSNSRSLRETEQAGNGEAYTMTGKNNGIMGETRVYDRKVFTPATPAAEQWQGWGTSLKPSYEPIIMARKPFKGTVAANVLEHGTGAINVDACRIGTNGGTSRSHQAEYPRTDDGREDRSQHWARTGHSVESISAGRWPANVILDKAAAQDLGEPARYFYCAKSSRRERNAGLEGMPERVGGCLEGNADMSNARKIGARPDVPVRHTQNHHPTVKPIALMRYLIQMVTPPGGVVLDPFMGSGSTLVAAAELGFNAIGIELSEEYAEIAARRVDHVINQGRQEPLPKGGVR